MSFFEFMNKRCPSCRQRFKDSDMPCVDNASKSAPFSCPACGAKVGPWLLGIPVIGVFIGLIGNLILYLFCIALLVILLGWTWWKSLILVAVLLLAFAAFWRLWPLVQYKDE